MKSREINNLIFKASNSIEILKIIDKYWNVCNQLNFVIAINEISKKKEILNFDNLKIFKNLIYTCLENFKFLKPKNISFFIESVVKYDDSFFKNKDLKLIDDEIISFKNFKPNQISDIISSFAICQLSKRNSEKKKCKEILNLLENEVLIFQDSKPQLISTIMSSYKKVKLYSSKLTKLIEKEIISIENFKSKNSYDVMLSFKNPSIKKKYVSKLFNLCEEEILTFKEFKPGEISNIIWSFSFSYFNHSFKLFDLLEKEILTFKDFKPEEISVIILSFAKSERYSSKLFNLFKNETLTFKDFKSKDILNIIWSYMLVNKFKKIINKITLMLSNIIIETKKDGNIFCKILLELNCSEEGKKILNEIDYKSICETFKIQNKESFLNLEVSKYLNVEYENNFIVKFLDYEIYIVDFKIKDKIIEICDPSHYLNEKENLKTKMKKRHLESLGYKVININYLNFENSKNKKKFIKKLLIH